ncbi:activated Cdc42 kinase-like [Paramacrobiotus metropolitanus]|uniref:activated Cdc42 kinase-like n=1 Tax=Paramacrobiotus metropolitanus TaxID=2943436 RepID=UPI002445C25E|nr:activated Cdc42 kinase-like [Paramacrobiotus metropolitanus]XP_055340139.1 activated Cdc42 kinase-like [Paramacrobiotus metropolitanus]
MNNNMAGSCPLSLHEFLAEAELQHYYDVLANDLKIASIHHLKYVQDEDLNQIGMSRPEQRRLKKFFQKYYPQTYLGKFVKIIQTKTSSSSASSTYNGSSRRNSGMDQWEGLPPPLRRDSSYASIHVQPAAHVAPANKTTECHVIRMEDIRLGQLISSGNTAKLYQGFWTNNQNLSVPCCIKCLNKDRLRCSPSQFLKEAATLCALDHERIVRVYGVVVVPESAESSLWLATELAPNRSLWECLNEPLLKSSLSVMTLCDIALQICDGMKYLETKRITHRNLCARKVLVFAKMKVKISDAGLNEALNCPDGSKSDGLVRDSRIAAWNAPECFENNRFSSSSDVWAFSVTLWEMFSMGQQPWLGYSSQQIQETIGSPNCRRLEQPELCPKDYYRTMLRCWSHEASARPTFAHLMQILPECKPEQLQAIRDNMSIAQHSKCRLQYTIGDVIVVLDNNPDDGEGMWKGIVKSRKPGLFDPSDTVAYLGTDALPVAADTVTKPRHRKIPNGKNLKIRREMISRPQADFRHTGHVGMDGAYFGDVSFLGNGFGVLPSLARSYERAADDERSMGGSRDTTPLIASRLSLTHTAGSESRMSSDSWHNTSSESPRSSSSHSSSHAKENTCFRDPSPAVSTRKEGIPPPLTNGILKNHKQQGYQNAQFEKDVVDGMPKRDSEKRFAMALRPQDEKSFDLDFGPSLMDEVFRMINTTGPLDCDSNASERAPLTKDSDSSTPTTPSTPKDSIASISQVEPPVSLPPVKLVQPVAKERQHISRSVVTSIVNTSASMEKPAIKPKPLVMARKKLDPISIVQHEPPGIACIKPVSPREEKSLESFIQASSEFAAKSLENGHGHKVNSPKPSSLKSRFSFRGLRGTKAAEPPSVSLPVSPRTFMDAKPLNQDMDSQVSPEGKEAYRVLVDQGQIEIRCPAPTPMSVCEEEEENEDASPLKLLRSGIGVVPKLRGNRNGFNRSLSHEAPTMPSSDLVSLPRSGISQSFRLPSKTMPPLPPLPTRAEPVSASQSPATARQLLPPPPPPPTLPDCSKRSLERPHNPPPLPPRDRSKPILGPPAKPRERIHPLLMPDAEDECLVSQSDGLGQSAEYDSIPADQSIPSAHNHVPNCSGPLENPHYQNPHSPGLLRDKSPTPMKMLPSVVKGGCNTAFERVCNGHGGRVYAREQTF